MGLTTIAGKPSNVLGDKDSTLILRGSSVKIQWGNKFIDVIKNGKIASEYEKILKIADSIDSVTKDGIYLIEESVWAVINGVKVQLCGDSVTTYVSFLTDQKDITAEQKDRALTNIGFYYNTFEEAQNAGIVSGVIYVKNDNKLYLIKDGIISEYTTQAPNIEQQETPVNDLYIEDYSLWVNGEQYITCENNEVIIHKQAIFGDNIYSLGASSEYGYRLYMNNGKSYLEVDYIIERGKSITDNYESIKIYSVYNNIILHTEQDLNNNTICKLARYNQYKVGQYIYIVATINISGKYNNGIFTLTADKPSSRDINIQVDTQKVILTKGQTQISVAVSKEPEFDYDKIDELFEYEIIGVEGEFITVKSDTFFIKNCKYIYVSREPLIKIENNNLSLLDRSIMIEGQPDELEHTRIGVIKESEIKQLEELYKEPKDRPKIGIFSDNLITLNAFSYNSVFKSIRKDEDTEHPIYPKYDKKIDLPKDKQLIDKKFNYSVPDIEWVKRMMDLWIPIGTIIMFDGKSEIPPGWAICDGDQGTPNLIGRFVKADTSVGPVNPTGVDEQNQITIKKDNLPNFYTEDCGELTTDFYWNDYLWNLKESTTSVISSVSGEGIETSTKSVVSSVSASTQGGTTTGGIHNHEIKGGEKPIKIEPRHYSLIFIMKVKKFVEYENE